MSLNDKLAAIKAGSNPPADAAAVMQKTKEDLIASGLHEKTLKQGDPAPTFELPNIYGDMVSSTKLLQAGPVVLHFYRGGW